MINLGEVTNIKWLSRETIFLCYGGSRAYGTNVQGSDIDYRGVCIAPKDWLLSPFKTFNETQVKNHEFDLEVQNLAKFITLASDCNPSVIELLWVDDKDILLETQEWSYLKDHRNLFLSQKICHTFTGYAISQLNRIKRHKRHFDNPPTKPHRKDYGLTDVPFNSALYGILSNEELPNADTEILRTYFCEQKYKNDLAEWNKYSDWKKNRNPVRAELEEKMGYDGKHAAHLVRLLRMGKEILTDGIVRVKRPDATELLSIRNGAWTYHDLIDYADNMESEIRALQKTTSLPYACDKKAIEELYLDILDMRDYRKNEARKCIQE